MLGVLQAGNLALKTHLCAGALQVASNDPGARCAGAAAAAPVLGLPQLGFMGAPSAIGTSAHAPGSWVWGQVASNDVRPASAHSLPPAAAVGAPGHGAAGCVGGTAALPASAHSILSAATLRAPGHPTAGFAGGAGAGDGWAGLPACQALLLQPNLASLQGAAAGAGWVAEESAAAMLAGGWRQAGLVQAPVSRAAGPAATQALR